MVLVPLTFKSYEKHDELRGGAREIFLSSCTLKIFSATLGRGDAAVRERE